MSKNLKAAILAAFLFSLSLSYGLLSTVVFARDKSSDDDLTPLRRVWRLQKFLNKYESPLVDSSAKFIEVSEKYNLDWRFLVAISGIESTFGKFIPYESYNSFGYDNGQARFSSFDESIDVLGRYLFEMKNKGYDSAEKLGPTYTPPNFRNWISSVNYFMSEIGKTEL